MKIGTNMAIFVLFFGIALVEAFHSTNWLLAGLILLVGLVFLRESFYTVTRSFSALLRRTAFVATIMDEILIKSADISGRRDI
jgi:hypothetical protein